MVSGKYDLIGPPRSISNLRPWKFAVPAEETELQRRLRELRQETQNFNQEWWTKHNTEFKDGREEFIKDILSTKYASEPDKTTLSADEMSTFYRDFMNKNWSSHLEYNKEWQRRNWNIIWLMFRVKVESLLKYKK